MGGKWGQKWRNGEMEKWRNVEKCGEMGSGNVEKWGQGANLDKFYRRG
jgi:hypothetical protein